MYSLLLVEDEAIIRDGMKVCLDWRTLGIEIAGEAADGLEALELARRLQPDIVLTDVVMAEMDGIEFVRLLRGEETDKTVHVVMISGHENVEYMKAALKLDVVDYLLKPFHTKELEEVIRKVLAQLDDERRMQARLRELEAAYGETDGARGTTDGDMPARHNDLRKAVRDVIALMRSRYAEDLSLAQLAAHVHLSPNYLANLFKRETGKTLGDTLTDIRIGEAKKQLREDPQLLITALAERVGYRDSKHFTKLFKREVGVSPSEYRDSAR
jgi:two-component system response regulator YesN